MVLVGNSKTSRRFEMYSQLPDYDDFQGYDMGIDGVPSRIARKIYANFHKSSWKASKRGLFTAKITKKHPIELRNIA